jgi:hypothetical protein
MKLRNIQNRLNSNRADSNTVSIIVWISITVLLVLAVGKEISKAVLDKGKEISKDINDAGTIVTGGGTPAP